MKRAYAGTSPGQIHYYDHGHGEPLLMLHATPRSAKSFAPLMERLGARFHCVAPDLPGFGLSDPLPADASMESLARTMVSLLDELGIARAHVIGFHTGNKIAAAMAAHFPDRVGRVMLIGMTHSLVVSRRARNAAIMTVVRRHMGDYAENADGTHRLRTWAADFGALSADWWNPAMLMAAQINDEVLRGQEFRVVEGILCRRTIKKIYSMNFDFDFTATLKRVKAPALVIECCVPEEAHLGAQGPKMLKLLREAELLTLKGAAFDATEAFAGPIARATLRFVGGGKKPAAPDLARAGPGRARRPG